LPVGEGDAMRANAVVPGGVNGERTPAAADVEKGLVRLKPQLTADHVELVALRSRDVIVRLSEKCTAVDHLGIEKERVELVRKIVVILNVLSIGRLASIPLRKVAAHRFERPWSAARDKQEARRGLERLRLVQGPERMLRPHARPLR